MKATGDERTSRGCHGPMGIEARIHGDSVTAVLPCPALRKKYTCTMIQPSTKLCLAAELYRTRYMV